MEEIGLVTPTPQRLLKYLLHAFLKQKLINSLVLCDAYMPR